MQSANFNGGKHLLSTSRVSGEGFEHFCSYEHTDRFWVKSQQDGGLFDRESCRES